MLTYTIQEIDKEELRILQDFHFNPQSPLWRPAPSPRLTLAQAYSRLIHRDPEPSPNSLAAAQRLAAFYHRNEPVKWDLVIKIFNDFSTVFFHGDLHRRVYLTWAAFSEHPDLRHDLGTRFAALGFTCLGAPETTCPRVYIAMRADFDWAVLPRLYPLVMLLHEMLHAYFMVHCGKDNIQETPTLEAPDPMHGTIFKKALRYLRARSNFSFTISGWRRDLLDQDTSLDPFF